MNRRNTRFFIFLSGLVLLAVLIWQTRRPMILNTAKGSYRVINVKYVHGTNLTFSADIAGAAWCRKQLNRIGFRLRAPPDATGRFWGDGATHAIAILCKARVPNENLDEVDVECETKQGQTVPTFENLILHGPNSRVCFVFLYTDIDPTITNLAPKELRIFRKSDHQELTRLTISP